MKEFKGTKGIWTKELTKKGQIIVQIPQHIFGERILYTTLHLGKLDPDDDCNVPTCCRVEEHANAQLIAMSPELLQALQMLLSHAPSLEELGDGRNDFCNAIRNAEAIIDKALTLI